MRYGLAVFHAEEFKTGRMIRLSYLSLLAAVSLAFFASQAYAIVNGAPVDDEQFAVDYPWAVVIVKKSDGGICGGALIAPRWIVTAAHCTGINKYVLVGHADRTEARRVEIERAIRNPEFDKTTLQNDVGLLFLAEALDIEAIALASAAETRAMLLPGAVATIVGWGVPAYRRSPAERLVEGRARLDKLVTQGSQYIYDDPNTGPCGRDSGGPMVMQLSNGRRVLVGVASATDGNLCAKGGGVAIYTNLSAVLDFIDTQIQRFTPEQRLNAS